MLNGMDEIRSVQTALRLRPSEVEEIDRRAGLAGLSRTEYMLKAALGQLKVRPKSDRLTRLEARVKLLEQREAPADVAGADTAAEPSKAWG